MKKQRLLFFTILICSISFAQTEISYGIKVGVNSNSNEKLNVFGGFAGFDESFDNKSKIGFEFGAYAQFDILKVYIRPELVYFKAKSAYETNSENITYTYSSFEIPVLVGYKFMNIISGYAGPSAQLLLENKLQENIELDFDKQLAFAFNIGAIVKIQKFQIDLRYTKGLSKNLASYLDDLPVDGLGYRTDAKTQLIRLSLAYELN